MRFVRFALGAATLLVAIGCGNTDVTDSEVKNLASKHSEQAYDEAMKKQGRGAELEEQKRIQAERDAESR